MGKHVDLQLFTGLVFAVADKFIIPAMNENEMLHSELSRVIVGFAMTVLNELKPGLDEKAYENALAIELRSRGLRVEQQRRFEVRYRGVLVWTRWFQI